MTRKWIYFTVLLTGVLFLSGCRVRLLRDPAQADEIRVTTAPMQETTTETTAEAPTTETEPETSISPQTTQPVSTQPATTQKPDTEATEEPETSTQSEAPPPSPAPSSNPPPSSAASAQTSVNSTAAAPRTQPAPTSTEVSPEAAHSSSDTAPEPEPVSTTSETEQTTESETQAQAITVTLHDNGGDTGILTVAVLLGESYGALPRASRRGWSFDGWWTALEGGELIRPTTIVTCPEDHTLFAHWAEAATRTIHFDGNGGRVRSDDRTAFIRYGEAYGQLPTPLCEGYAFLGWWTAPVDGEVITAETVFLLETNQTLYAHWRYDAEAYWRFVLRNGNQRRYLCQQAALYLETEDGRTMPQCSLLDDTESYNIAEHVTDPSVTDEWVTLQNPAAILKVVSSMANASEVRAAVQLRFPDKPVYLLTAEGLGDGPYGLYARLALCKSVYPDWFKDVDLATVAAELELTAIPFS